MSLFFVLIWPFELLSDPLWNKSIHLAIHCWRVSWYEILFCTRTGQSAQLAAPQSLQPSLIPSPSPNSAHNILVSCIFHPALSPFYIHPHPHLAIENKKQSQLVRSKIKFNINKIGAHHQESCSLLEFFPLDLTILSFLARFAAYSCFLFSLASLLA